jgi:hypothetical protein
MLTFGELQLKTIGVVQDAAGDLPSEEVDRLITEAIRRYSRIEPLVVVEDEVGDGTSDIAVSALAQWNEGLSLIRQVEYPFTTTDPTPRILEHEDWMEYVAPAGRVLRFLKAVPQATQTARITYTTLHQADADAFTIPEHDFDAVSNWAAALCCRALANKYAQLTSASLQADSVDHRSKSESYAKRAKDLLDDVKAHFGIKDDETAAGGVIVDWPAEYSFGFGWLTHERRRR